MRTDVNTMVITVKPVSASKIPSRAIAFSSVLVFIQASFGSRLVVWPDYKGGKIKKGLDGL